MTTTLGAFYDDAGDSNGDDHKCYVGMLYYFAIAGLSSHICFS